MVDRGKPLRIAITPEAEDIFQVWMKDKEMRVSEFVLHLLTNSDDHLKYLAPLEFQARARSEYH